MNHRIAHLRSLSTALILWTVCSGLSGCELDRPSFQMNSNSPTPFFGFDLLPRRRTTSLVRPPVHLPTQSPVAIETSTELASDSDASSAQRVLLRHAKLGTPSRSVVIPLSNVAESRSIDRGPVELLP